MPETPRVPPSMATSLKLKAEDQQILQQCSADLGVSAAQLLRWSLRTFCLCWQDSGIRPQLIDQLRKQYGHLDAGPPQRVEPAPERDEESSSPVYDNPPSGDGGV